MDIFYFYPSHDLALANGIRHFNPPAAARQLQDDLKTLPKWFCQTQGAVLTPQPWGWNYDTCQYLRQQGIDDAQLPNNEQLQQLRQLSNRCITLQILKHFEQADIEGTITTIPQYITTADALDAALMHLNQQSMPTKHILLKAPWSSSGRGLCWSRITPPEVLRSRGLNILHSMGGVIIEPEYHKVQDLAMLFCIHNHKIDFTGYSIFDTDDRGTYRQGMMRDNNAMIEYLSQWVSADVLNHVKNLYLQQILPALFKDLIQADFNVGYIGIDMIIVDANKDNAFNDCGNNSNDNQNNQNNQNNYQNNNKDKHKNYLLQPCLEMNVRCTMGVAARLIFDQHVCSDSHGQFVIAHAKGSNQLQEMDHELSQLHPQKIQEGRFQNGYFRLTEIQKTSQFMAYLLL